MSSSKTQRPHFFCLTNFNYRGRAYKLNILLNNRDRARINAVREEIFSSIKGDDGSSSQSNLLLPPSYFL